MLVRECAPGGRPFKDVAILLRSSTSLSTYLDALKDAGVRYAVEADRYFFGTQESVDFLNLLRVLDDPGDRLALAGLLRSPLAALEDRELYSLSRAKSLTYLKDPPAGVLGRDSARRLGAFFAVLRRLRAAAGRRPLAEFISMVLRDTLILELGCAAYHGDQTASNLLKFTRLAAEAGETGSTLKEFIARVEAEKGKSSGEGESPLADEQLDAVRILTIHKAKGLEFPVVIIPNLAAKRGGGFAAPAVKVDWSAATAGLRLKSCGVADLAMALIEHEEALREEHETRRLLYVAMTRAREKLFLLGAAPSDRTALGALLQEGGAWAPADSGLKELTLDASHRIGILRVSAAPRARREALAPPEKIKFDAQALAKLRLEREKIRDQASVPLVSTPSALLREAEKPRRPFDELESPAGAIGARTGQLCHRVLEGWDFKSRGELEALLRSSAGVLEKLYPESDWAAIAADAREALEAFASSAACRELARALVLGREVPFAYPAEGRLMRGAIDLLVRVDGKLWVVDYKTDRIKPGEAARRAAFYAPQGRAYGQAASLALGEAAGFKVIFLRTGEAVEVTL